MSVETAPGMWVLKLYLKWECRNCTWNVSVETVLATWRLWISKKKIKQKIKKIKKKKVNLIGPPTRRSTFSKDESAGSRHRTKVPSNDTVVRIHAFLLSWNSVSVVGNLIVFHLYIIFWVFWIFHLSLMVIRFQKCGFRGVTYQKCVRWNCT